MRIKTFQGGFDDNLSYIISCDKTNRCALIDASISSTQIIEYINNNNLLLDKVLITHTHHDHISYLDEYMHKFPSAIICGHSKKIYDKSTKYLEHNQLISIGQEHIIALYTPGHYWDSMCYYNYKSKIVFTGDTVFVGRTGRTIGKRSNIKNLYNSVYKIILTLPQDTMIYPGHHYGHKKSISIKENIRISNFFQCNNFSEFNSIMKNFELKR